MIFSVDIQQVQLDGLSLRGDLCLFQLKFSLLDGLFVIFLHRLRRLVFRSEKRFHLFVDLELNEIKELLVIHGDDEICLLFLNLLWTRLMNVIQHHNSCLQESPHLE